MALPSHLAKLKNLTTVIQRMREQAPRARYDLRASLQKTLLAGGRRMSIGESVHALGIKVALHRVHFDHRVADRGSRSKDFTAAGADLLEQLKEVGVYFPEPWQQNFMKTSQKKALLRTLIDKIDLHRIATDQVRVRVVWRGDQTTTVEMRVPVNSFARLSDWKQIQDTVAHLAREGQTYEQIAAVLTVNGYRAPLGGEIAVATGRKICFKNRVLRSPKKSRPFHKAGYLTIAQLADKLKVTYTKIYWHILDGTINVRKDKASGAISSLISHVRWCKLGSFLMAKSRALISKKVLRKARLFQRFTVRRTYPACRFAAVRGRGLKTYSLAS